MLSIKLCFLETSIELFKTSSHVHFLLEHSIDNLHVRIRIRGKLNCKDFRKPLQAAMKQLSHSVDDYYGREVYLMTGDNNW